MNFYIKTIQLWLFNGRTRKLEFKNNKINIVTGKSKTGKTSIFKIINYCLLSSENKIPDDINKNVEWYGIEIVINGVSHCIVRKNNYIESKFGNELYYKSELPDYPIVNISKASLTEKLMSEFSIADNICVPYGGKKVAKGSRFSFRDFMLFNLQDGDTIDSEKFLFINQDDERKREVLERIFDFALKVATAKELMVFKEIEDLNIQVKKLESKKEKFDKKKYEIESDLIELIKKAKELELINRDESDYEKNIDNLKTLLNDVENISNEKENNELDSLKNERFHLKNKASTIKKFLKSYNNYFDLLKNEKESLDGYEQIMSQLKESNSYIKYEEYFQTLELNFNSLKNNIKNKRNNDIQITSKLNEIEEKIKKIDEKIQMFPEKILFFNEKDKYIFLGELNVKLGFLLKVTDNKEINDKLTQIRGTINELEQTSTDINELRRICITELEDTIGKYVKSSKIGLGEYSQYKPYFNLNKKTFSLRKPFETKESILGSTSNDVFLHTIFFLGYHEYKSKKQIEQIPNFMILDQPSRPYYGDNDDLTGGDESLLHELFKIIDDFINFYSEDFKKDFQFIVLEHIPKSKFNQFNLKNIHIVDEFINGKGLIPEL